MERESGLVDERREKRRGLAASMRVSSGRDMIGEELKDCSGRSGWVWVSPAGRRGARVVVKSVNGKRHREWGGVLCGYPVLPENMNGEE
ncbi:hypothetical protein HAX54_041027, partial [Datura stramonium]|nr:hypothetical protein [Datura stramonium]